MSNETRIVVILSAFLLFGCGQHNDSKPKPKPPYWSVTFWTPYANMGTETFECQERPQMFGNMVRLKLTDGREVMLIGSVVMKEETK